MGGGGYRVNRIYGFRFLAVTYNLGHLERIEGLKIETFGAGQLQKT